MTKIEHLLDFFRVSEKELKELIDLSLSSGGNYADLFFEYSITEEITLKDNEVCNAGRSSDYGMGIRVLSGDRSGYAYTENTSTEEMKRAATTAAKIASINCSKESLKISDNIVGDITATNYYPILQSWEELSTSHRIPYLKELNDLIFEKDTRVIKVFAELSNSTTTILFFNSEGTLTYDIRPLSSLSVTCIMQSGSRIENGSTSRSFRVGSEFLTHELIKELADEIISKSTFMFEAVQPNGGEMPVVMGAGSSGILLHEAIGHTFEADFNRKNISIFADKLGKKICSEKINVLDDGTLFGNRGAINIDDEGIPSQKTYMVKDGILNSFLHDRISAAYYKTEPTGNGRRESFRYAPLPRMRATYMENGDSKESDIIASVKRGIFVDNFSNGQVEIGAGDFTFFVKSGYLIENGRLTKPIKDINIIGNGPEALADIVAIADNSKIDNSTWTCGKEQYCPVSCGMPSVLVRQLTVGGL